jgi:hypothetical protein
MVKPTNPDLSGPDLPDLPDLEDLITESSGSIPDLDDLLGTAKAEAKDKAEAKAARQRLVKGGLSDREREEDLARLREWESRNLYKPVANVACFIESSCTKCGDYTYLFTGLMERQVHRHVATTQRWLKTDIIKTDLDNEVMVREQTTPFCVECMADVGFTFNNAYTEDGRELVATEQSADDDGDSSEQEQFYEEPHDDQI